MSAYFFLRRNVVLTKFHIFARNNIVKALSVTVACTVAFGGVHISAMSAPTQAVPMPVPPPVLDQPDTIAWQQFIAAVKPSSLPGKVTYETWASDQNIYVANPCTDPATPTGCNVPTWPSPGVAESPKMLQRSLLGLSHARPMRSRGRLAVQVIGPDQGCSTPGGIGPGQAAASSGFPTTGCVGEEVRRDRASFDYLVQNGLWSRAGLTKFYKTKSAVTFPVNALQVKADWIPVTVLAAWLGQPQSFVTTNFYTSGASTSTGVPVTLYAMTSMHISVKSPGFPDWVWANFENAYTPGRCDQTGCTDNFGAAISSVPAKVAAWTQYGACPKTAQVSRMMINAAVSPVFANYCLTGSQTGFGTKAVPTLLGSPIIEAVNADVTLAQSSCISCHARASFNATSVTPPNSTLGPTAPPPGYVAYDFMWGLLAAS
jgi:hypothetical protein